MTGLSSRAMTSHWGRIRIPIYESADEKSPAEEFLREHRAREISRPCSNPSSSTRFAAACRSRKDTRGIRTMPALGPSFPTLAPCGDRC